MPTSTSTTCPRSAGTCRRSSCCEQMDEAGVDVSVIMTITDAPEVNRERAARCSRTSCSSAARALRGLRAHAPLVRRRRRSGCSCARSASSATCGLKLHPVSTIGHPADEIVAAADARRRAARRADDAALRRRPLLHAAGDRAGGDPGARGTLVIGAPRRLLPRRRRDRRLRAQPERHGRHQLLPVPVAASARPIDRCGVERVIWGSDGPGCPPGIELAKLDRVPGLTPGRARRRSCTTTSGA